ncbi:MAG: MFS transporter [Bacilli bacterium]|nr:MFS transporter [Bacilli bacterium]
MEKEKELKFDKAYLKRTLLIGMAFFGILLVWQLYNSYCSPMLSFLFAKVMYPDEYASAYEAFMTASQGGASLWNFEKYSAFNMTNILIQGHWLSQDAFKDVQWVVGIVMALDNIAALFIMPIFGNLSDKTKTKIGKRMPYILVGSIVTAIVMPFIPFFFNEGMAAAIAGVTGFTIGMIAMMVLIIVFMMSYRSPAVALMPDLTPKPLRSRANGWINIVGYVGGFIGSIFAIIFPLTKYLDGTSNSLLMLEIPFIACSLVLVASVVVLFFTVKENKLAEQLHDDIVRGEAMGESAEQVTADGKLSKNNVRNLALILVAEVLWFMSLNAIETFQSNYFMFHLNTSSAGGVIMTVVSGAASIIGFITAGIVADKIGRKWTIFAGICAVTAVYFAMSFYPSNVPVVGGNPVYTFENPNPPIFFFITSFIMGLGASFIHICSFPLVTDYCTKEKLGRYTSLYYAASMGAQSITPILGGLILKHATFWNALPIYSTVLMAAAGIVFFFVKAPHNKDTGKNVKGLEALGADD